MHTLPLREVQPRYIVVARRVPFPNTCLAQPIYERLHPAGSHEVESYIAVVERLVRLRASLDQHPGDVCAGKSKSNGEQGI